MNEDEVTLDWETGIRRGGISSSGRMKGEKKREGGCGEEVID